MLEISILLQSLDPFFPAEINDRPNKETHNNQQNNEETGRTMCKR